MSLRALGETARFINGVAFKPTDWSNDGLPIIRIQNLTGTGEKFNYTSRQVRPELVVDPGDLLVSWSATLDVYRWNGPRGLLNQHIFKVLPEPGVDPDYLFYALKSALAELSAKTHGSTMKHVVRGDFESTRVQVPPIPKQQRIVDLLARAEGIVRLRREAEKKAAELIPSLFFDMFGDPATNPKGWKTKCLNDVSDVRDGTHDSPKYHEHGIPFITSSHLRGNGIDFSEAKLISPEDHAQFSKRSQVDDGDILLGMIGTIGKATIVKKERDFSIKNVALIKRTGKIHPDYLWALLSLDSTISRLLSTRARGGNQKFVSLGALRSFEIPVPTIDEQNTFSLRLNDIRSIQSQQAIATVKAVASFDALLAQELLG
jgi:type I restriction enzyme S subunit